MFRIDRFLSLHFFHPLVRKTKSPKRPRIPILMYHGIIDAERKKLHPYFETATSPTIFAEHMQFLKNNQYEIGALNDIFRILEKNESNGKKIVLITFDDGLQSFYDNAFPVLDRFGFAAVVYLPAGLIGIENRSMKCMSWAQLRELKENGVVFGSHSVSHPELIRLDWDSIEFEIKNSKNLIEKHLSIKVDSFSYPFAFPENNSIFVEKYCILLKKCGYKTGVTTRVGRCSKADYPFLSKRIPVNTYDDKKLFSAKLDGAYDWVYHPQSLFKLARGKLDR